MFIQNVQQLTTCCIYLYIHCFYNEMLRNGEHLFVQTFIFLYLSIYYCNKNEDIKLSVHVSGITLIIIAIFINFSEKNC